MPRKLEEIGSGSTPETIWTLPVEKVKNEQGKDEYIISIPDKVRKHLKLKEGDKLFWGERLYNTYEVRKASKEELYYYKIELSQDNAIRQAKIDRYSL
jgi:bifunctional DNA-binding transcriptional regulator/antitoxin component of YhaV-PrlF toxin-antitoxin module